MSLGFNPIKIFSGSASFELAESIASNYGEKLGKIKFQKFKDGEIEPYYEVSVRGADVYIIQSTIPPAENIMELLLLIDAAKRASANDINVIMPYYGYARQDRKDKPRSPIGAKLLANILSAAGATRIITMDLHAAQIQGFFDIPVVHLDSSIVFVPLIRKMKLENLTIASPDIGGVKRARLFADLLGTDIVMNYKHREKANEVSFMQIIGDVKNKNVILVDDLVDTGNTLVKAAQIMKEKGALSVRAACTHPVLSGNAYENIEKSELKELIVCDTIPISQKTTKIRVVSVSKLFAQAIKKIYSHGSISELFKF